MYTYVNIDSSSSEITIFSPVLQYHLQSHNYNSETLTTRNFYSVHCFYIYLYFYIIYKIVPRLLKPELGWLVEFWIKILKLFLAYISSRLNSINIDFKIRLK